MQQVSQTNGRSRINFDSDNPEDGLAQLVLTVIELVRQIVERHAMRRVEGGTLTDQQVEDLGVALMNLEEKMEELKEIFGLDAEDLNIDLGPLGSLM
ncbi:gas vesicle protein GvpK [[Bacillus] enclensis]|jgi:Gas vesicle protein K|uniref:Gas vesicle protein K n=1 Tax=[Bacillus] enclensis TaxID=1402860 RepID=A0A0V8H3Z8_9BACI|nr:gas vesicle protein K [[Bacillus] enclensis]KSU57231.1 gas vesicle protein GvpK [[Bacillus] enclensis]SCC38240.1 Gas vesicle protein K [[Bacillus] enclensis]